jgi:hypothetical protein
MVKYNHWLNKTLCWKPIMAPIKMDMPGNIYRYHNDLSPKVENLEYGTGIER